MIRLIPYTRFSKSAKSIVETIGKSIIRRKLPVNQPARSSILVNWGCSNIQFDYSRHKIYNKPDAIKLATNKRLAFDKMKAMGIPTPEHTTDASKAKEWLNEGFKVLCRHTLSGHSGKGIEVLYPEANTTVPYSPLYVKYHKKKHEFRVHVFNGQVIDYVEKKKRLNVEEVEGPSNLIRSHSNGWVFCRDNILIRDDVKLVAIQAVRALGLDFGAVDLILSKDKVLCLEVNSAPGCEGQTLTAYATAIKRLYVQAGR